MKTNSRISTFTLALALAGLIGTGCATSRPVDTAAKTLAGTVQTVDTAMQAYAAAVVLELVSVDDQAKVRTLYSHYQAAVIVAESAIAASLQSGDTGGLSQITAALTAARDPLLALLYGPAVPKPNEP